jgi:fumarate hydratase class II
MICENMGEKIEEFEEEVMVSRMFLNGKKPMSLEEELAFYSHRFNLDRETIETMPAFEEHLKPLFSERKEK